MSVSQPLSCAWSAASVFAGQFAMLKMEKWLKMRSKDTVHDVVGGGVAERVGRAKGGGDAIKVGTTLLIGPEVGLARVVNWAAWGCILSNTC